MFFLFSIVLRVRIKGDDDDDPPKKLDDSAKIYLIVCFTESSIICRWNHRRINGVHSVEWTR